MDPKEIVLFIRKGEQHPANTTEWCARAIFASLGEIRINFTQLKDKPFPYGRSVLLKSLLELYADTKELFGNPNTV